MLSEKAKLCMSSQFTSSCALPFSTVDLKGYFILYFAPIDRDFLAEMTPPKGRERRWIRREYLQMPEL
jgi:hypothetical protein